MRPRIAALLISSSSLLAACERRTTPEVTIAKASADTLASAPSAPSASATPAPSARPGAAVKQGSVFVRHPPHSANSNADAVDECTQSGGNYFSCRWAYHEENDPIQKRYLWRIAQGHAAGQSGYAQGGPPSERGSLPHAEVPFMCDPRKPCGFKGEHGEMNASVSCLARAFEAYTMNDIPAAKAAHAHACKCDPKDAAFPGYNTTAFICNAAGKPAFIAPTMKRDEGADILDCAICQPERGPAACQREIERLKTADPELSSYVETRQIPRCKTPNEGPTMW